MLARGASLAIDPLFLFAITSSPGPNPCIYIDGTMLLVATLLRTCVDAFHVMNLWLKFRLAYVSKESLNVGNGELVWDARAVVKHYVGSVKGFWFDLFVILPVPQVSAHYYAFMIFFGFCISNNWILSYIIYLFLIFVLYY